MDMMMDCPAPESWRKLLRDDVLPPEREALEGHLDGCTPCSIALVDLAGRWSLADLAGHREGRSFGDRTLEILGRLMVGPPEEGARSPASSGPVLCPVIPGLADLELVGRGGMGMVFRAREVNLDRPVAVKVLSSGGRLAPSARARAVREAMLMASLRHPNVVPVHRSGEVEGLPYLVMEWVGGGTLQDQIKARVSSPREAAETVRALAGAVAGAHALGIIHRDLKPDNVMMAPSAGPGPGVVPKLTDFGLARRGAEDGVTETGVVLGTPGYMAPEQTGLDRFPGEVGPASDIHGLGAILFACLIGRAPYSGATSWESIVRTARGAPASIRDLRRDVPRDLATIAEKCLQTSPGRRYRSAGELADDLGRFLEGRPIAARPVSAPERWLKWARRRPALAATTVLLGATSLGGVAGMAYHVATIQAEQVKTKAALASATSARDRARSALGSLTDDAVQRMVQRGKALDEGDRAFLGKIRGYYQDWPLEPDPEAALKFRASGLEKLGDIFEQVDQYDEAKSCREAAIAAYDEAIRSGLAGRALLEARLKVMVLLHQVLFKMTRFRDAEAVARRVIESRLPLASGDKIQGRKLAVDYIRLGEDLASLDRHREADETFEIGIGGLERLRLENPADPAILEAEMRAYYISAIGSNRRDRVLGLFRTLVSRAQSAIAIFPENSKFLWYEILGLDEIVSAIREGQPEEALELHRRRMDLARGLVALERENGRYRGCLVTGSARTYDLCARMDRPGDAEADLERAVEEGERMVASEPAVFDRTLALVDVLSASAKLFEATGRPRRAIGQYDRIATTLGPWTKLQGRSADVVPNLVWAHRRSATLQSKLGDHREAARRLGLTLDLCEPKDCPEIQGEIAKELLAAGDIAGAKAAAEKAAVNETADEAKKFPRASADPVKK